MLCPRCRKANVFVNEFRQGYYKPDLMCIKAQCERGCRAIWWSDWCKQYKPNGAHENVYDKIESELPATVQQSLFEYMGVNA